MTLIEQIKMLERLHALIQRKATGTPTQLAAKFEVTERTVRNGIFFLKNQDLPIQYCRERQTYFYECEVEGAIFSLKRRGTAKS
jgi:predicted DNA-binding transcriptional regulator YafY